MKFILLLLAISLLKAEGCNEIAEFPSCLLGKIEAYQTSPQQNPPVEIYRCSYNDQTVYHITAPCCDQFTTLLDSECEIICRPEGGITGMGDGKCQEWAQVKETCILVWKDDREKQ